MMAFTVNGWSPEKPKARLVGGGGPGFRPPTNLERATAARQDAVRGGYQVPRHAPAYIPASPNQLHGPAKGGSAPMGLRDWQQMTGVYDAPVDRWRDTWTPTGFGVPGVPRGNIDGLQDFYGRNIGENGVVDSIPQAVAPPVNNTRDVPKKGPNGMMSKGTQTSPASTPIDMNRTYIDLLNTVGGGQFSSNQLPTTSSNPFEGSAPQTQTFNTGAESYTNNSLADYGGDGSAAFAQSRERTANDTFNPSAGRIEGGSSRRSGGSLDEALADTAGINSYMSKFSSGDQQRRANGAFLDTEGSYKGLRAKEKENGVVYAGGHHYVSGKTDDSPATRISSSAAREISYGRETSQAAGIKAQDFLQKKKAQTIAAAKQTPAEVEPPAVSGAFTQDKPMVATYSAPIEGGKEFYTNNDNAIPSFGNNGGYKSKNKSEMNLMQNFWS